MLSEKLLAEEKEGINFFIENYAVESAPYHRRANIDTVLQPWGEAKSEYLYDLFGKKFILSKDISYSMGLEELGEVIEDELFHSSDDDIRAFVDAWRRLTWYNGPYEDVWGLNELMDNYTLAKNVFDGNNFTVNFADGSKFNVQKGCKVSKVMGKLAKGFGMNMEHYEKFRIAHSQILNQKALKGRLCISIHPLDYMTMSANDCGWTSCMDWTDCGEYRRGTVEMMNSPCVVVAYLTAKDPYVIRHLNWSNKKWRQLFIVNQDLITGVKAYPYYNEHLTEAVASWLKELAKTNLNWDYMDRFIEYHHSSSFYVEELDRNLRLTFWTHDMYNDFGSTLHNAYLSKDISSDYQCTYSGMANCMWCGSTHSYFDTEHELVCEDCEDCVRCADCGDRHDREDMIELDGEYYCEYCYNSVASTCEVCTETHHNNNNYSLFLGVIDPETGDAKIYRDCAIDVCWNCQQAIKNGEVKKYFTGTLHDYSEYWSTNYYVLASECTEEGLHLFGFDSLEDVAEYKSFHVVTANFN